VSFSSSPHSYEGSDRRLECIIDPWREGSGADKGSS